jgi:hypothetical protein
MASAECFVGFGEGSEGHPARPLARAAGRIRRSAETIGLRRFQWGGQIEKTVEDLRKASIDFQRANADSERRLRETAEGSKQGEYNR